MEKYCEPHAVVNIPESKELVYTSTLSAESQKENVFEQCIHMVVQYTEGILNIARNLKQFGQHYNQTQCICLRIYKAQSGPVP